MYDIKTYRLLHSHFYDLELQKNMVKKSLVKTWKQQFSLIERLDLISLEVFFF